MERIEGESDQSGTDSEAAETVAITSESEGELEVVDHRPAGIWAPGRFSSVRVTASNPLLRRTPRPPTRPPPPRPPTYTPPERIGFSTASSSSSAARTSRSLELPWGVEINPIIPERTDHQWVLSIDWHQVLDTVRLDGGEVRRPGGYYILDCAKVRLQQLKLLIPSLVICVNSYCHCAEYRQGVLSIRDFECIDYRIVTRRRW